MIYWRFCDLFKNYVIYWRIQRFIRDFCNLFEISVILCVDLLKTSVIYWRILRLIGDFCDLLENSKIDWRFLRFIEDFCGLLEKYWRIQIFNQDLFDLLDSYVICEDFWTYYTQVHVLHVTAWLVCFTWMNEQTLQADRIHALFIVNIKVWNLFWKR